MAKDDQPPFIPQIDSSPVNQHTQRDHARRRMAIMNSTNEGSNAALLEGLKPEILLLQSVIVPGGKTVDGTIVEAVDIPFFDILKLFEKDPDAIYQMSPRKFEEIIAAAYAREGYEVTLTPPSNDGGRDVIAVSRCGILIRVFDQAKKYAPGHVVKLHEVDSLIGVLSRDSNVSKGFVTTTSTFAPRLEEAAGIKNLMPYRLELRDRSKLLAWFASLKRR